MVKLSKNGKPLGRPVGSRGKQTGNYVVAQIEKSMGLLEKRGTSLAEIIAARLMDTENPDHAMRMLSVLSQYLPKADKLEVEVKGDSLSNALAGVSAALKAGKVKGDVIDAEPIEDSVAKLPQSIDNAD